MIKELYIKNFKCFIDKKITFRNLSVLAGINGVGKSTVIQALLLLHQAYSDNQKEKKVRLNDVFNLQLGNSKGLTSSHTSDDSIFLCIKNENGKESKVQFLASSIEPEISASFEFLTLKKPIFYKNLYYLVAERLGPRALQKINDQAYLNTGFSGEYTGYALYKKENDSLPIEKCLNPKTATNLFKKQVEEWMNLIVPGVEINANLFEVVNAMSLGIRKRSSGTDYLHPFNIGFGISYVLPIVVTGLLAEVGSIMIVENPEAHLHPSGQSRIGFFLAQIANSGIQVIIETHSEHVINGIRLSSINGKIPSENIIFNFFSQSEKSPEPNLEELLIGENGDLSNWPKGFFDQQQKDIAKIFISRKKK